MTLNAPVRCFACLHALLFTGFAALPGLANSVTEEVIITAARRGEQVSQTSRAASVIDAEMLAALPADSMAEYFAATPGVFVQSTGPGQGNVFMRGLKGSELLYLVDGMRLNTAFFRNAPNNAVGLIDPFNIERLEAVRGPVSALYGSDAMGGVVQVFTSKPEFGGDELEFGVTARTILRSADHSAQARLALSAGNERFAVLGGASYFSVGRLRPGGGPRLDGTAYNAKAADVKFLFRLQPQHELMLSASYYEQPETPRYDAVTPGFGQNEPDFSEFFFAPQARLFLHGRYEWRLDGKVIDSFTAHLGYQEIRDDRRMREFMADSVTFEQNKSKLLGVTAEIGGSLGAAHAWNFGIEHYGDKILSARQAQDVTGGPLRTATPRFPDDARMNSFAVFVSDIWQATDELKLNAALRYNRIGLKLMPENTPLLKLSPEAWVWNIGARYELNEHFSLVSNIGRGFRAPNIFDLGALGDRPGGRFSIPNSALSAEAVMTYELGGRWVADAWQAEVFGFISDFTDKITAVETGAVTANGQVIVQNQNVAALRLHGIEAQWRWTASARLSLYGVLNYTYGEEQDADGLVAPADRIAPLNGRLGTEIVLADDLIFNGYVDFAGRQNRLSPRDRRDPRINPAGTTGYATMSVKLRYEGFENTVIAAALENITDRNYRAHGSGIDAAGFDASLSVMTRF